MPPLIPKLGTVPALFDQYKQRRKAHQGSSLPGALTRTPVLDPIDLDLAREQRYECYQYILQQVRETQLQRAEQGVVQDHEQGYRLTREQQEACDELRAHGYRGGMGGDGTPLESPSYGSVWAATSAPTSGSQISPLDNTHRHGLRTDGAFDRHPSASNMRISSSRPSKTRQLDNENMPANSSRATSTSVTRSQQRENIGTGSQQLCQEANRANKQSLTKTPQTTSSEHMRGPLSGRSSRELKTPDTSTMPGSYFPLSRTLGQVETPRDSSPNTLSTKDTDQAPAVDPNTSPNGSPRASSDYHSAPEDPSQARFGLAGDETVDQENGTLRQTLIRPGGLQIHGMGSETSSHRTVSSLEKFPSFRQSLANVATPPDQEVNNAVANREPMHHPGQRDVGGSDAGGPAREPHRPNACSNIDYKQLLREINVSYHLPETKMDMAIELVGMLQEFKNQAYKEKADSEADMQTEIDRWEAFHRNRTDTEILSLLHPNDQLIRELEELPEGNPWVPILIPELKRDKDTTRKIRQLLKKLQKNRQLSEDTLIGERNNSDDSGEAKSAQKDRQVSRTWTTRAGRKWSSWIGSNFRATKARVSVVDPGVFKSENLQRPAQQISGSNPNTPSAPVPSSTADVRNDQHEPGASNPEIALNDQPVGSEEHTGNGAAMSGESADTVDLYTNKRPAGNLGTIVDQHFKETLRSSTSAERLRADPTTFDKFSSAPNQLSSGGEGSSNLEEGTHDQAITSATPSSLNGQQATWNNGAGVDQNDIVTSSAQGDPAATPNIPKLTPAPA
ncbi:hypothetical protein DL98DRAFT_653031 [Cadophora sp. DSE1049]|nr:hypothetical protein DL98DRAFT_653031 [Cadophora sp. DSE1049]